MPLGSIYLDSNGNILETNRAFAEIMGSSVNKINKLNIYDFNNKEAINASNETLTSGLGTYEGWYTSVTSNKTIYAKATSEGIYDEKGKVSSIIAVAEDNTESYYKEKELEKLANIFRDSINEIYIFDADSFRFIDANRSALENVRYTIDELRQLTPLDIKFDISKEDFEQIVNPLKTGEKKKVDFTTYHYRSDGSKYPVDVHLQLMEFEEPVFVAFAYDVTEKKEMESRFQNIFNFIDDSINIIDTEGNILNTNRQGLKQYGYSFDEITKMNIRDIRAERFSPDVKTVISDIVKKGSVIYELEHKRKDGSVFPVEINATYIQYEGKPAILNVIRDITERKRGEKEREELTRQITQTQKLEAVGQLAGGIAHDFNNFLAGIMAYIDILVRSKNLDKNEKEYLSHMMQLSERSAKLVQNMMAFSRKQVSIPQVVDINNQLGINKKLYKKMIKENISLTVNYYSQPVYVKVDPVQLDQVVLNLISNARDAIEESGNISITVSKASSSEILKHSESIKTESNDYCLIEVTDDGSGMDEETAKRIFE
ncbi:MAG TPA: hypothetical protein DHM44_08525, partial [Flexistipes sinusarabici]|nr:hypothetical protein [Flexistipes sinusarabici]